ncbi:putative acyltransferase [Balneicella halophila]|uniref:Putative acyltransferase n=1 Tax=Balneicella halophila TaxID=1537566 RepID=A0A7L4UST4_BALHA|nr:DUF5009 domain-containing protein [Balneicella halophila]PVX52307.1 putative acyltransferase [Balneicella halophila]
MKRLLALDVMRGLTIALMITVNTPGSWKYIYPPLRHASWHGCTPTDLVFPFFLFIVGTAMWFSFKKNEPKPTKEKVKKVAKRVAIIFLIGLLLNLYPYFNFSGVRIMGVLQRIALAYGVAGFLVLYMRPNTLKIVSALILLAYWLLLYYGGNPPYGASTNIVGQFDKLVLGENHIWRGLGFPFEPEGLLSTFPAVVTVLLGYFAGSEIAKSGQMIDGVKRLLFWGVLFTAFGWVWGYVFPINKSLWTSTYVLYTGGLATILLAVLLWLIDVRGYKKWTKPFVHFGMNPLFIFVLSGLYVKTISYLIKIEDGGETINGYTYLYQKIFVPLAGNMNGSLLFALTHIVFFWIIVYLLYRKRIFIKI